VSTVTSRRPTPINRRETLQGILIMLAIAALALVARLPAQ
jgi:hypothetical protein